MEDLEKIIDALKLNDDVDAVFITGSFGAKNAKPYSDIDLVVLLNENKMNLYSLYRWVDGIFADIFFFDMADMERISSLGKNDGNAMDGIFMSWLKKADIRFDKSGVLADLKNKTAADGATLVSKKDKQSFWQKINYNFCNLLKFVRKFHNQALFHIPEYSFPELLPDN